MLGHGSTEERKDGRLQVGWRRRVWSGVGGHAVVSQHGGHSGHSAISDGRAPAGHTLLKPVALTCANDLSRKSLRSKGFRSARPAGWVVGR